MTQRARGNPRCDGCGLTPATCVCAQFPRVRWSTPVAIVQHARERFKPTSTGRLLARMVEGLRVLPYGLREPPFDPAPLRDSGIEWRLLYPHEGAPLLDPRERRGLILLDGTWNQCARMARRAPWISRLPCVALPPGPPSFWTVQAQHQESGLPTFEAALRAVEPMEGPAAIAPLRHAFAVVAAQLLHLKGRLRSPEIPVEWGA